MHTLIQQTVGQPADAIKIALGPLLSHRARHRLLKLGGPARRFDAAAAGMALALSPALHGRLTLAGGQALDCARNRLHLAVQELPQLRYERGQLRGSGWRDLVVNRVGREAYVALVAKLRGVLALRLIVDLIKPCVALVVEAALRTQTCEWVEAREKPHAPQRSGRLR